MEMIFLRDAEMTREWLAADPGDREVFTLQEAIESGSQFVRRDGSIPSIRPPVVSSFHAFLRIT